MNLTIKYKFEPKPKKNDANQHKLYKNIKKK